MKKHGHYCKVCGEYKANEKFSGKGHTAHICKACAKLPPEKQAEEATITRILNLPYRLSKEQIHWLEKRTHDKRSEVKAAAREIYSMRFPHSRIAAELFAEMQDRSPDDNDEFHEDYLLDDTDLDEI